MRWYETIKTYAREFLALIISAEGSVKADFPNGILEFGSLWLEIGQKDERTRLRGIGESLNITERKV